MTINTWKSGSHRGWTAATLVAIVGVLALTHIPQDAIPLALQKNGFDKVEHVAAYGLIATFFLLSLRRPVRPVLLLIGLATLAVTAAFDEVTQPLVNRQASIGDYAADLIGMVVACGVHLILRRPQPRTASS